MAEKSKIDSGYVAGFFDGEGSAIILTIKIRSNLYRFRPVIKISQKNPDILFKIKDYLGVGHIVKTSKKNCFSYNINGNKGITHFINTIGPKIIIKQKQIKLLSKLIKCMKRNDVGQQLPYSYRELKKILKIRQKIHKLNLLNRDGIFLKHSSSKILKNMNWTKNVGIKWHLQRCSNGGKKSALIRKKQKEIRLSLIPKISCLCGCGTKINLLDKKYRSKFFVCGHNNRKESKI